MHPVFSVADGKKETPTHCVQISTRFTLKPNRLIKNLSEERVQKFL